MNNNINKQIKGFSVMYKDFKYWQVSSMTTSITNQCFWPTIKLSELCKVRTEVVPSEEIETGSVVLLDKISFDIGKIFSGKRLETKMKQYRAKSGDIVVSKINARKKAIGIVTGEKDIGITSHFRSLKPNNNLIITKFLWLALRSNYCSNQFSIETGGIGKGEISEERLLSIEIPLPPLNIQEYIVDYFEMAENEVNESYKSSEEIKIVLDTFLKNQYKKGNTDDVLKSSLICINWNNLSIWDVKNARAAAFRVQNPNFKPLRDYIEESTHLVKPWEEPEKDWPVYGVNNKDGVFFNYYQKGKDFNSPYKLIKEDWFFHNPTRASVGSLGRVSEVPKDALTSPEYQVWKIKKGLIPDFVALLISTPFFIDLIQFHRVGGVKQRLYVDNLLDIRIPEISEEKQKTFVQLRKNTLTRLQEAKINFENTKQEIEELIAGRKKPEDT